MNLPAKISYKMSEFKKLVLEPNMKDRVDPKINMTFWLPEKHSCFALKNFTSFACQLLLCY